MYECSSALRTTAFPQKCKKKIKWNDVSSSATATIKISLTKIKIPSPPMKKYLYRVGNFLYPIIDFFYPPFKKLMPLKTFRYAVSGAGNTFLGLLSYYITYKFILQGKFRKLQTLQQKVQTCMQLQYP
jgi:hypothetical protein